ncbi:MAG TPA: class I SAM-dependent methyltransferase [Blastocatellia bacterium]
MDLPLKAATSMMRWGSRHRKFGCQDCYTAAFVRPSEGAISIATRREFDDGPAFFLPFEGILAPAELAGKDVLDLGCGHGGRTAYYALQGRPRSIVGVEISSERTGVGKVSAKKIAPNAPISFAVGFGENLPFARDSFDLIISYDVFEHVQDLPEVLSECRRVLRPGGRLYALFPPYFGPRTHHLDFVTTLPFIHYVFSPGVLVRAANQILKEQPGLRDAPLPEPRVSYLGRKVLPRLNGTTEKDFRRIAAGIGFISADITLLPFAWGPGGRLKRVVRGFCRLMLALPWPFTRDIFAGTIRSVFQK